MLECLYVASVDVNKCICCEVRDLLLAGLPLIKSGIELKKNINIAFRDPKSPNLHLSQQERGEA